MADDFELTILGAKADFAQVARDCKAAGKAVEKELYAGLERAARPLQEIAKEGADVLPSSGGSDVRVTRLKKTGTVTVDGREFVTRRRVKTKRAKGNESLADRVKGARFTIRLRGGRSPGVKLIATARGGKSVALGELDKGNARHPVYGNRGVWVDQAVTPGWWSDSLSGAKALAAVRAEVIAAVEAVVRKMVGS